MNDLDTLVNDFLDECDEIIVKLKENKNEES